MVKESNTKTMQININTNQNLIFLQYLHIINPIRGKNKLSNTEIAVLSRILLIDHIYKAQPKEVRDQIIFSAEARNRIMRDIATENPAFSKQVFNNTIMTLKRKGLIKGNKNKTTLLEKNPFQDNPNQHTLTLTFTLHGQDMV